MSIRVAPQAYKTRAHIYIICTPPQNIFKLFSSRFCVLPPLSSLKHFQDNFISIFLSFRPRLYVPPPNVNVYIFPELLIFLYM